MVRGMEKDHVKIVEDVCTKVECARWGYDQENKDIASRNDGFWDIFMLVQSGAIHGHNGFFRNL